MMDGAAQGEGAGVAGGTTPETGGGAVPEAGAIPRAGVIPETGADRKNGSTGGAGAPRRDLLVFPAYNIGHSELLYFLKSFSDLGLMERLLLVCPEDFLSSLETKVPHFIPDGFDSVPELVEKLASWKDQSGFGFGGVLGIDEELHFGMSKAIASKFGLWFHGDDTRFMASNKYLSKRSFEKAGVPTARFALLDSLSPGEIERVGFPNVLKILCGTQSQYIFRSDGMEELEKNFGRLLEAAAGISGDPRFDRHTVLLGGRDVTFDPRRQFLLESFVSGEEFSCDFLVRPGGVEIIRVAKKFRGPYLGLFRGYLLLDGEGLQNNRIDQSILAETCRRIARSLEIDNGVCMVDFKSEGGRLTVLETSIRPGLSAFNHLMYEVYGYTSLALMGMSLIGAPLPPPGTDRTGAVVYIYGPEEGDVESVDTSGIEALQDELDIFAVHIYRDVPGETGISDVDRTGLLRGYVLLGDPGTDDIEVLSKSINSRITFRMKEHAQ